MSKRSLATEEPPPSISNTMSPEQLTLSVLSVMSQIYGASPKDLWGLSHAVDLLAPRGIVIESNAGWKEQSKWLMKESCPVVSLRTSGTFDMPLTVPKDIKRLTFAASFKSRLDLSKCEVLQELVFQIGSSYTLPLGPLPLGLKKLQLSNAYNLPVSLPVGLQKAVFGTAYNTQVTLPVGLKEVFFRARFNQPIVLPLGIRIVHLADDFNQPLELVDSVEVLAFDQYNKSPLSSTKFNHPLILPESMRKLTLSSEFDRSIALNEGLEEISFGKRFNQKLTLPSTLKMLHFHPLSLFNHDLILPPGLKEVKVGEGFRSSVTLPNGEKVAKFGYNRQVFL